KLAGEKLPGPGLVGVERDFALTDACLHGLCPSWRRHSQDRSVDRASEEHLGHRRCLTNQLMSHGTGRLVLSFFALTAPYERVFCSDRGTWRVAADEQV